MSKKVSLDEIAPVIKEILSECGEVSFVSAGQSMLPTIGDRTDTVTLVKVDGKLKKGDVVFYLRDNGQYILHRIRYINNGTYVMRGDNQWYNEYNIRQDQIIAKLKSIDKNGKTWYTDRPAFRLYSFFLPVVRYSRKYLFAVKSWVYSLLNGKIKK